MVEARRGETADQHVQHRDDWFPGPAWLFCPADRPDRYPKALAAADVVILDLEDAVAPDRKDSARATIRQLAAEGELDTARTVLRVNSAETVEHAKDVELIAELSLPRVMLAKAEHPQDVRSLECDVVPLVETARGVEWCGALAEPSNVLGLMWGADDLIASMGGTSSRREDNTYRDVARYARSRVLTAAKACGRLALDAVHMDLTDLEGMSTACEDAVAVGFDASVAIHPAQIAVIKRVFQPTAEQLAWASSIANLSRKGGVGTFEGRMVDGPIFKQAERLLRLAETGRRPESRLGGDV